MKMTDVTIITLEDIGTSLSTTGDKLNIALSAEQDNLLVLREDGLYLADLGLGSMAEQNVEDYLTKTEIETDYALKTEIPTKVSDLANDAGYVTQATLPADKFLANARLEEVEGVPTLILTLNDDQENPTEVSVSLQDLVPVSVGEGISGTGTTANPIKLDVEAAKTALGLGSMAYEDAEDYLTKVEIEADYATKVEVAATLEEYVKTEALTITLKDLQGNVIGIIHPAAEAPVEP